MHVRPASQTSRWVAAGDRVVNTFVESETASFFFLFFFFNGQIYFIQETETLGNEMNKIKMKERKKEKLAELV